MARIRGSWQRHGRFLNRVAGAAEQTATAQRSGRAPCRSLGRERGSIKAFGTGLIGDIPQEEIEITNNTLGAPCVKLSGAVADYARSGTAMSFGAPFPPAAGIAAATVVLEEQPGTMNPEILALQPYQWLNFKSAKLNYTKEYPLFDFGTGDPVEPTPEFIHKPSTPFL